jgi:hypothetical protein
MTPRQLKEQLALAIVALRICDQSRARCGEPAVTAAELLESSPVIRLLAAVQPGWPDLIVRAAQNDREAVAQLDALADRAGAPLN